MPLPTGSRLGPYEILAPAGAGGMGEVYKARDTRLNRSVAIKVLPEHVRDNDELRRRFEREAQAVAGLDHPHICALHDISHHDGVDFLVMEFLEGETLADRLARGALPLGDVLSHGMQIAEALDQAHRRGIVHRDLKPANIMLTKVGVKVLDFGIAKVNEAGAPTDAVTAASTRRALTSEGTILGTVQYMAPEQLEGGATDARTDIFALGVVLYEMVTGRRAFDGNTTANVIAAILAQEPPPITMADPAVAPALGRVVKKAMAKDPDRRWQSASDLADELRWIADGASSAHAPAVSAPPSRGRAGWIAAAVLGLGLALAALPLISHLSERPPAAVVTRFAIAPPNQHTFNPLDMPALSPDGRSVVFSASDETQFGIAPVSRPRRLWLRRFGSMAPQNMPGTDGAMFPFWSADGQHVAFFADGKLKKIAVADGARPEPVCDAPFGGGGTWNDRGEILFAPSLTDPLHLISATGGQPKPVTTLNQKEGETRHVRPHFLPDGRSFLFLARLGNATAVRLHLGSLDHSTVTPLDRITSHAEFAPPDQLLFVREGALMTQTLDLASRALKGEPVVVAHGLTNTSPTHGQFAVSASTLAYVAAVGSITVGLTLFDRLGRQTGVVGEPADYSNPAMSPDGKRVAIARRDPQTQTRDIWIFDLDRGSSSRLTFDPADDFNPVWSGDGLTVMFSSMRRPGERDIYRKLASGTQPEEVVLEGNGQKALNDWSRDGRFVVYDTAAGLMTDIYAVALSGDRTPVPIAQRPFNERSGVISPDGRWIAYASNESGVPQVWVQTFPEQTGRWQVSTSGGTDPMWRSDGRELFFQWQGKLTSVTVAAAGSRFEASVPHVLFNVARLAEGGRNRYVVTPDGQRFLAVTSIGDAAPLPLTVVLNWPAVFEKR